MEAVLGNALHIFLPLTGLFGIAAFATGHGVASRWQPAWQVVLYCCLLAAGERFLDHALADGDLLSVAGFLLSAVILSGIGLFAWRLKHAHMMVTQYPWLYEPAGPFGWREKQHL